MPSLCVDYLDAATNDSGVPEIFNTAQGSQFSSDRLPNFLVGLTSYFQFYNQEKRHQSLYYQIPSQEYQIAKYDGPMIVD